MPYRVNYNSYDYYGNYRNYPQQYYSQQNNPGQTLGNAVLGAAVAPLIGISPLVGLGLGAFLLGGNRSNTNIININTSRNCDWDDWNNGF